jgi:hypothetical protein
MMHCERAAGSGPGSRPAVFTLASSVRQRPDAYWIARVKPGCGQEIQNGRDRRVGFKPEHYSERASELEAAAKLVSDADIRSSYVELARSFRKQADLARLDRESVGLAERMIGHTSHAA